MFSQITTRIAIGNYVDARAIELLKQYEIDCILNVNDIEIKKPDYWTGGKIFYYWSPVPKDTTRTQCDYKKDINDSAKKLEQHINAGWERMFVHCLEGIDRAPAVVAKYLMNVAHITPHQAYDLIQKQRPEIFRHVDWIQ